MCDNFAATPEFTGTGHVLMAKNSDREPNEAQELIRIPATEHAGGHIDVTYIAVPQVPRTNEVILSKPFHMWGAEMGVNEHNVAIGNEALFTTVKFPRKNLGLTGMDMLRLALERTASARAAMELICKLVEEYGQDACGGYRDRSFFYCNSFMIADPQEVFVLETIDRHWAAIRVKGFRSISNGLTIESEFDYASDGLEDFAARNGKHRTGTQFNLRQSLSDWLFTTFGKAGFRRSCSTRLGADRQGRLDSAAAMEILRSHNPDTGDRFHPGQADNGSLCMHASGPITRSQTTGSMVAELRSDGPSTFWFTGTAAPCLSVFKPLYIPGRAVVAAPDWKAPGELPDDSLWWRHELVHRFTLGNYARRKALFEDERGQLEAGFLSGDERLRSQQVAATELDAFSRKAFADADAALARWWELCQRNDSFTTRRVAPLYSFFRNRIDREVGLEGTF